MAKLESQEEISSSVSAAIPPARSVRRQLVSSSAEHPATLLPIGVLTLATIYLLVLAPVFGSGSWAGMVIGISAGIGLANFAYRYRHDRAATIRSLENRQSLASARMQHTDMQQRVGTVRTAFEEADLSPGSRVLESLDAEYERLRNALSNDSERSISAPHISVLVHETYDRGLSVLANAAELAKAIRTPGKAQIERDVLQLTEEIDAMRAGDRFTDRLRIQEETLAMQERRLEELDRLQVHVDELLFHAHRCEMTLHHTRIELASIKTGDSNSGLNAVIDALEGTVQRAKEVQEELMSLGY